MSRYKDNIIELTYNSKERITVNEFVKVPVPDGFRAEVDFKYRNITLPLVIVPKSYPKGENPLEAPVGLIMQNPFETERMYDTDDLEMYFNALSTMDPGSFNEDGECSYYDDENRWGIIYQPIELIHQGGCSGRIYSCALCVDNFIFVFKLFWRLDRVIEKNDDDIKDMFAFEAGKWIFNIRVSKFVYNALSSGLKVYNSSQDNKWHNDDVIRKLVDGYYDEENSLERMVDSFLEKMIIEESFNRAIPKEGTYPHYHNIKNTGLDMPGATVIVNSGGTEYEFLSFKTLAMRARNEIEFQDEDDTYDYEAEAELYERIAEKDREPYELANKAEEMSTLFHVNKKYFDPHRDRECEIRTGLMHRAYMMSGLRSFAWTLNAYCKENKCKPKDINYEILSDMIDFIADDCDWLNYDQRSCKGICSGIDFHVYYIPDSVSEDDKAALLPTPEETEAMLNRFTVPWYQKSVPEARSLNALRKELEKMLPAIECLHAKLKEDRNFDEHLEGNVADILYAWCALALAAKEPFFSEDGPSICDFKPVETDRIESGKTTLSSHKTKDDKVSYSGKKESLTENNEKQAEVKANVELEADREYKEIVVEDTAEYEYINDINNMSTDNETPPVIDSEPERFIQAQSYETVQYETPSYEDYSYMEMDEDEEPTEFVQIDRNYNYDHKQVYSNGYKPPKEVSKFAEMMLKEKEEAKALDQKKAKNKTLIIVAAIVFIIAGIVIATA